MSSNWIKGALNKEHKGYCSPMSKSTCTPRRKALAKRFKSGDLHNESAEQVVSRLLEFEFTGSYMGEQPVCPLCNGPSVSKGNGGGRLHFECQDCGTVFNYEGERGQHAAPPAKASFYPSMGGPSSI